MIDVAAIYERALKNYGFCSTDDINIVMDWNKLLNQTVVIKSNNFIWCRWTLTCNYLSCLRFSDCLLTFQPSQYRQTLIFTCPEVGNSMLKLDNNFCLYEFNSKLNWYIQIVRMKGQQNCNTNLQDNAPNNRQKVLSDINEFSRWNIQRCGFCPCVPWQSCNFWMKSVWTIWIHLLCIVESGQTIS